MATKRCTGCGKVKQLSRFNFKNKSKGRRNSRCKLCTRKQIMTAYYKNQNHYLRYRRDRNREIRHKMLLYKYEYLKGHPCVDCGIADPRVLHFDHVRGVKKVNIASIAKQNPSLKALVDEIKKCDVRCANCHAIKTAEEQGYYACIETEAA